MSGEPFPPLPLRPGRVSRNREAYFLDPAEDLVGTGPLPLMPTGGIIRPDPPDRSRTWLSRTRSTMTP